VNINWGALLVVAFVSFGSAVGVVVLVSLALLGLSARANGTAVGDAGVAGGGSRLGMSSTAGTLVAGLCLLGAVAIAGYGLYIIIN
jgi:hypothetical protein